MALWPCRQQSRPTAGGAARSAGAARRAIEALRAGVPNRDAVRALAAAQPRIEARFRAAARRAADDVANGRQTPGLLVAGDFGAGKSHLLEHLRAPGAASRLRCAARSSSARRRRCTIRDKLYRAAIEAAVVPGPAGLRADRDRLRPEARQSRLAPSSPPGPNSPRAASSSRFPATLFLFERVTRRGGPRADHLLLGRRPDRHRRASPLAARARRGRDLPRSERGRQARSGAAALHASPRLMAAAGYAGWVLLVDEVELIGRYSFKQRARSYAELARWAGKLEPARLPGPGGGLRDHPDFSTLSCSSSATTSSGSPAGCGPPSRRPTPALPARPSVACG